MFFWVLLVFFGFFIFLLLKVVRFDKNALLPAVFPFHLVQNLEILIKMHFFVDNSDKDASSYLVLLNLKGSHHGFFFISPLESF